MIDNGPIVPDANIKTVAVGAGEEGYSEAFDLVDLSVFALEYKVECTGTPNVKLEIQQRSDPTVDWYTPNIMADIETSLTNKNQHGCYISPIPIRYMRIKVTEQTESVADTVVTLRLSVQKRFAA